MMPRQNRLLNLAVIISLAPLPLAAKKLNPTNYPDPSNLTCEVLFYDPVATALGFVGTSQTGMMCVESTGELDFDFGLGILEIPHSNTLPATCRVGQLYKDDDATSGQQIYACESADTWALQGGGGAGSGDVVGPASSTDEAVARFDLATGKLLQNSVVTIDDSGAIAAGDGAVGASAYGFASDPGNGVWLSGSDGLQLTAGGVDGTGSVQIGSTQNDSFAMTLSASGSNYMDYNPGSGQNVALAWFYNLAGDQNVAIDAGDDYLGGGSTGPPGVFFWGSNGSLGSDSTNLIAVEGYTITDSTLESGDQWSLRVGRTLNDTVAEAGTQTFSLLDGQLTSTDVTGWDEVFMLRLQDDAATVFSVDQGGNVALAGTLDGVDIAAHAAAPDEVCFYVEDPVTDEQLETVWRAPNALTLTEIYCEATAGTTVAFDFNVDDGTPAGVNGSDVSCTTSGTTDSSLGGDTSMAAGDRLDIDVGTVTDSVEAISFCLGYTTDD